MEGEEMAAVEVRKVETTGEFQPFHFHPQTSRQPMTFCVVWGSWVAALLLKMTTAMQATSQDMDGTVSPCSLRWEGNQTVWVSCCCSWDLGNACLLYFPQIGDRVGPVGTGETNVPSGATGFAQRPSPLNWIMALNRQEALVSRVAKPVSAFCGHHCCTVVFGKMSNDTFVCICI